MRSLITTMVELMATELMQQ